ncbi:helix-turn-helix transcriptional regulator [Herbaspirillum frisingense]|uniref:S24 family peptidase n=1 Tax=Herbaspirillum frisingense TaxID=92645 RepID=UPI0039B5F1AC
MSNRRALTPEEELEAGRLRTAWTLYKASNPGATQTWFAAESGLGTQGVVSQYMRGIIPLNLPALLALCKVIGADPKVISPRLTAALEGVVSMDEHGETPTRRVRVISDEDGAADPRFLQIRTVRLRLQAGINGIALEKAEEDGPPVYMPAELIKRRGYQASALIAIKVRGDSMETTLFEGDTVVINTLDKTIADNQVYAVNYEGEDVVKRLVRDNGDWWLTSDNPDQRRYPRKLCRGASCVVIGKIVYKQSENI